VRRFLAVLAAFLVVAPAAGASPLLGIRGSIPRFADLTGQDSTVGHAIVGLDQGAGWGSPFIDLFQLLGKVPMIGLSTAGENGKEAITPRQLAQGKGDAYLIALNGAVNAWGQRIYIRPFGEMNGYWTGYCAFTRSGAAKPNHSTKDFRRAFARVYLIVHGGPAATINAKLKALRMPPISGDIPANPMPNTRVIWNPQGYGAPDIPANSAQAYYPGDRYVDVVGNDLYDQGGRAAWAANEALYKAHPNKPYAFPEWGLWGIDDPVFIRAMGTFVRTHRRTELLSYFDSKPGSIFDLGNKPKSRAAYRQVITTLAG
jgi:Glycosyl hydrolase family 26